MILFISGLVGLLCGSFANVLIARVPEGRDWKRERSRCPQCEIQISWYDNIPVLSWLWLGRRCRTCHAPISAVYPTVEIVVAAGFVAVVAVHGVSLLAVFLVYLVMISAALVVIDARHRRLPDALVLPALMVGAVAVVAHAALTQEWFIVARAASGAAILGGYYFVLWWVQPKGLGFGDVKTAGLLGLALGALGWAPLAVGAVLGPLLGGLAAMGAMLRHRRLRGLRIAYGPWLITGAWVGVLVGDSVWAGYFAAVSSWT